MAGGGRRNGDEILIAALAAGKVVRVAAAAAGIGERTVYRRLEDADFRQRITDVRGRMLESAAGRLSDAAGMACERLKELLEAESESVQLGAARTILDQTIRLRELLDIETRMTRLEERCAPRQDS